MTNAARRSSLRVTVFLVSAGAVGGPLAGEERVFVEPSHGDFRVDACESWGQGCGQRAGEPIQTSNGPFVMAACVAETSTLHSTCQQLAYAACR